MSDKKHLSRFSVSAKSQDSGLWRRAPCLTSRLLEQRTGGVAWRGGAWCGVVWWWWWEGEKGGGGRWKLGRGREGCDSGFVRRLTRRPTKPTVAPITPSGNDVTFSTHMSSHSEPLQATERVQKATVEPLSSHCRATPSHEKPLSSHSSKTEFPTDRCRARG